MVQRTFKVVDGPDKPALQWSAVYPDRELDVQFKTDDDAFDVRILEMEELSDAMSFKITGDVTSGPYKGAVCDGVYNVGDRSGSITLTIGPM